MDDRFSKWTRRARTCYRGAGQLDAVLQSIAETADELERDSDGDDAAKEAVESLRLAQLAANRARDSLKKALEARTLTSSSREPHFGLKAGS